MGAAAMYVEVAQRSLEGPVFLWNKVVWVASMRLHSAGVSKNQFVVEMLRVEVTSSSFGYPANFSKLDDCRGNGAGSSQCTLQRTLYRGRLCLRYS